MFALSAVLSQAKSVALSLSHGYLTRCSFVCSVFAVAAEAWVVMLALGRVRVMVVPLKAVEEVSKEALMHTFGRADRQFQVLQTAGDGSKGAQRVESLGELSEAAY